MDRTRQTLNLKKNIQGLNAGFVLLVCLPYPSHVLSLWFSHSPHTQLVRTDLFLPFLCAVLFLTMDQTGIWEYSYYFAKKKNPNTDNLSIWPFAVMWVKLVKYVMISQASSGTQESKFLFVLIDAMARNIRSYITMCHVSITHSYK